MADLLQSRPIVIVALGVAVFTALLVVAGWEVIQDWWERRRMRSTLERVSPGADAAHDEAAEGSILRETSEEFGWVEPLVRWVPGRHDLERLLHQADLDWSVEGYLVLCLALGASAGGVALAGFGVPLAVAVPVGVAVATTPYGFIRWRRKRRLDKFEEFFPDAVDLLARSIKAGHAFTTGLQVLATEAPGPVQEEFRQVFEEQRYGMPIRESLLDLADRVELLDVRIFVTSVLIQRESGGNLAEILENLSTLIRDRFRFRRSVRTKTAHGRITAYILGAAPVFAAIAMCLVNWEYMQPLFTEELGHMMLGGAAAGQVIGFVFIRRIVDVEF